MKTFNFNEYLKNNPLLKEEQEFEIDGYKVSYGRKPSGDRGIIVQDTEGNILSGFEEDSIPEPTRTKVRDAKDKIGRKNFGRP
jgi:hypothetical protein